MFYKKILKFRFLQFFCNYVFKIQLFFIDLFDDPPSPTEKNFKKLLLQPVYKNLSKIRQNSELYFSGRIFDYGLHWLFRQTDSHSDK